MDVVIVENFGRFFVATAITILVIGNLFAYMGLVSLNFIDSMTYFGTYAIVFGIIVSTIGTIIMPIVFDR